MLIRPWVPWWTHVKEEMGNMITTENSSFNLTSNQHYAELSVVPRRANTSPSNDGNSNSQATATQNDVYHEYTYQRWADMTRHELGYAPWKFAHRERNRFLRRMICESGLEKLDLPRRCWRFQECEPTISFWSASDQSAVKHRYGAPMDLTRTLHPTCCIYLFYNMAFAMYDGEYIGRVEVDGGKLVARTNGKHDHVLFELWRPWSHFMRDYEVLVEINNLEYLFIRIDGFLNAEDLEIATRSAQWLWDTPEDIYTSGGSQSTTCAPTTEQTGKNKLLRSDRKSKRNKPTKTHRRVETICDDELIYLLENVKIFDSPVDESHCNLLRQEIGLQDARLESMRSGELTEQSGVFGLEMMVVEKLAKFFETMDLKDSNMSGIIIDMVLLVGGLYSCTSLTSRMMVLTAFAFRCFGHCDFQTTDILTFVKDCLSCMDPTEQSWGIDTARLVINAPALKHLSVLASACVTLGFLNPFEYSRSGFLLFSMKAFEKNKDCVSLLDMVLESIAYFCDTGWEAYEKWSWEPFYLSSDSITRLSDRLAVLETHIEPYLQGNYTNITHKPAHQYEHNMEMFKENLNECRALYKGKTEVTSLTYITVRFQKLYVRYESYRVKASFRVAPYCFKLFGSSGVGKSSLFQYTMATLAHANNLLPEDSEGNKEPMTKYTHMINLMERFDQFKADTLFVGADDVCNGKNENGQVRGIDSILIPFSNNMAFTGNFASLEEKGVIQFRAKGLGLTTNVKDLEAKKYSNNVQSILRRVHSHVDVRVKTEYSDPTGSIRKDVKIPATGISNIWLLTIEEPEYSQASTDTTKCHTISVLAWRPKKNDADDTYGKISEKLKSMKYLKDMEIDTYLEYIAFDTRRHFATQEIIVTNMIAQQSNNQFCGECGMYKTLCVCEECVKDKHRKQQTEAKKEKPPSEKTDVPWKMSDYLPWFSKHDDGEILPIPPVLAPLVSQPETVMEIPSEHASYVDALLSYKKQGEEQTAKPASTSLLDLDAQIYLTEPCENDKTSFDLYTFNKDREAASPLFDISKMKEQSGLMKEVHDMMVQSLYGFLRNYTTNAVANLREMIIPNFWERKTLKVLSDIELLSLRCRTKSVYGIPRWWECIPSSVYVLPGVTRLIKFLERGQVRRKARLASIASILVNAYMHRKFGTVSSFALTTPVIASFIYGGAYAASDIALEKEIETRKDIALATLKYHEEQSATRGSYQRVWNNVSRFTLSVVTAGAILSAIELVKGVYRLAWQTETAEQSALDPNDEEIQKVSVSQNIWSRSVSSVTPTTKTGEQLCNNIAGGLRHIIIKTPTGEDITCAMTVRMNFLIMPYHCWFANKDITGIPLESLEVDMIRSPTVKNGKTINGSMCKSMRLWLRNCERIGNFDACIVHTTYGGPVKDLVPYIWSQKDRVMGKNHQTITIYRDTQGEIKQESSASAVSQASYMRGPNGNIPVEWPCLHVTRNSGWKGGDCGSITVTTTTDPKIVGMHVLGSTMYNTGLSCAFTQEDVLDAIEKIKLRTVCIVTAEETGSRPTKICGVSVSISEKIPDSAVINFDNGIGDRISVYGGLGEAVKMKTDISSSMLAKACEQYYGPTRWGPPKFHQWKPWAEYMKQCSNPVTNIDPELLNSAVVDYLVGLKLKLQTLPTLMTETRPLTDQEVVLGIPGRKYVDRMCMSTSAGYPFTGAKSKVIKITETPTPVFQFLETGIQAEWDLAREQMSTGVIPMQIFKACLKDEVLPLDKEKVRVFQACPLILQLLIRQYFLPIARILSVIPLVSECAVGINCYGPEYEEMYRHIEKYGSDRILAGDYSKWDQRLPFELTSRAFGIMIEIARFTGNYSDKELKIMESIAHAVCMPHIMVSGTLYQLWGSNPSGQNLTVYINSISNSLLMRMGFFHATNSRMNFRQYVACITYGDDIISSVKKGVTFTFNTYKQFLENIGMKFTLPTKDDMDVYPDYLTVDTASFLKRLPVFIPEIGVRIGALEFDSILKSLYCYTKSKEGQRNVMSDCLTTAAHELFAHGRKFYDVHATNMAKIAQDSDIVCPKLLLSFDERAAEWKSRYQKENPTG